MAPKQHRSRIHLLAAVEASTVVVLQRKRAKLFHIITVDTDKHSIEEGSWFRGVLYGLSCDVSFDGKFMVYLARGSDGRTVWSGLCRLPHLKTLVDATGSLSCGGYFADRKILKLFGWYRREKSVDVEIPFKVRRGELRGPHGELSAFYSRLERDGFTRLGDNWGVEKKLPTRRTYEVACHGDDGWGHRYSPRHPELRVRYLGYLNSAHTFAYSLDAYPDLLNGASCATWDTDGNLWVARPGLVEQYTLKDLRHGTPSFSLDVDRFEPPPESGRGPMTGGDAKRL